MSLILKEFRADLSCSDDVEAFCDGLWVTRSLSRGCGCEVNLTPAGGGDRDCDEKHNKHDFRSVLKYERVGAIGLRVQWFLLRSRSQLVNFFRELQPSIARRATAATNSEAL